MPFLNPDGAMRLSESGRTKNHERHDHLRLALKRSLQSHWMPVIATSAIWAFVLVVVTWHRSPLAHDNHIPGADTQQQRQGAHASLLKNFKQSFQCGSSPEEARRLGCQYDMLSNYWVPKACMDKEAVIDYQADGSWHPYLDQNHTKVLSSGDKMGSVPAGYY